MAYARLMTSSESRWWRAITQMSKQVGDNIAATNNELKTVLLTAAKQTADSVKAAHDNPQLAGTGVKAASEGMKAIGEKHENV